MAKREKAPRILAVDPGTKKMGIALLEGAKLVYSGVEILKRREAPHRVLQEAREIILRLIEDFKPEVLAVEKPFFSGVRGLSLLHTLVKEIETVGKMKRLRVCEHLPRSVRKFITGDGAATKEEVARVIASRYPDLIIYLKQDRMWKEKHWHNMFDAIAVGLTCFHRDLHAGDGGKASARRPRRRH